MQEDTTKDPTNPVLSLKVWEKGVMLENEGYLKIQGYCNNLG